MDATTPAADEQPQELTAEQRADIKARLRRLFDGEPPVEMLDLATYREQQFEEARAAAQ